MLRKLSVTVSSVVAAACLLITAPTRAEPIWGGGTPLSAGTPTPGGTPNVAANPAPQQGEYQALAWMKPGVRLSYYHSKGYQTAFGTDLEPDKDGNWIDKKTRKTYKDKPMSADAAAGGYGIQQHDIVGVEDGKVAVDIKAFLARPDVGCVVQKPGGLGMVGTYEAGPRLWLHPRVLAQQLANAEANPPAPGELASVYRTTYQFGDRTVNAVRIVARGYGGYIQQTYDLETGIMLLETSATHTQGVQEDIRDKRTDKPFDGTGPLVVTYTQLLQCRQMKLPEAMLKTPLHPAFAAGQHLSWRGGFKSVIPGTENMPIPLQPMSFSVEVEDAGRTFSLVRIRETTNGLPDNGDNRVVGPASLAGWMVSPALFQQNLQPGTVLDEDPITKSQIVFVGQGADGLMYVADRGPKAEFAYGYDPQTGICRRHIIHDQLTQMLYDNALFPGE
ncbi:MAG: hypothetical protein QM770_00515 [Tepidisphaeraceae bacterium]